MSTVPGFSQSRLFPPERSVCEKGHGRIEIRAIYARAVRSDQLPFPHIAQVARIDRLRDFLDGTTETETVFAITSRAPDRLGELALGAALRSHWAIENGLHYRRDRTYDEDRHQIRNRATAQVLASLRNLAIAARHFLAPSCKRQRSRTLPQMHRRMAAKPQRALALITKPWI